MANRGSFNYTEGMPIYAIKVYHGDGSCAWKTFPSLSGLKSGIKSVEAEVGHFPGFSWSVQGFEIFSAVPEWEEFTP